MDYKKKYEDALKKATELSNAGNALTKLQLGIVFPELAESEDEKVRKEIIEVLQLTPTTTWERANTNYDRCFAWLGLKSKKKQYALQLEDTGCVTTLKSPVYTLNVKKQKESLHIPQMCKENADSFTDEDERIRKTLLRCCDDWEKGQFGCMAKEDVPAIRAYLKKQKEQNLEASRIVESPKDYESFEDGNATGWRRKEQKPAEWSEEDEGMLKSLIGWMKGDFGVTHERKKKYIKWLKNKFVKLHPKPHWKPSEEQMNALQNLLFFKNKLGPSGTGAALDDLYKQLEQL